MYIFMYLSINFCEDDLLREILTFQCKVLLDKINNNFHKLQAKHNIITFNEYFI